MDSNSVIESSSAVIDCSESTASCVESAPHFDLVTLSSTSALSDDHLNTKSLG